MFKNLYDSFKHWYHGGSIYFYSDPHFGDADEYCIRFNLKRLDAPFMLQYPDGSTVSISYLDQMQIDNINKLVHKNDTLVVLGDVGDAECIKRLKAGYKVLVLGNHDKGATTYKRMDCVKKYSIGPTGSVETKENTMTRLIDNHLFDEVYEGPLMISDKILLSHEPVDFKYALNIHGHDHSLWSKTHAMHHNVCAELINYTPVSLKSIVESGKLKNVPNIHRETIDKASNKQK